MTDDEINDVVNRLISYDIMRNANIGLVNIDSRVKMLFGEEYGISVKSSVGKGTAVTVRMPYRF